MAVPRGGVVTVKVEGAAGSESFTFLSKSDSEKRQKTLMPSGAEGLLSGAPEGGVDARGIQPFYTGILARMTDMELKIGIENDVFMFSATPKPVAAAA
jgi:histidine phosphotransferase ChpT